MNRQQAPQPVVRPLPVLTSANAAREYILSQPVSEDGRHIANFLLSSYRIDAGGEDIVPLVVASIFDNYVGVLVQRCEVGDFSHYVDGTGVTTQVLCDSLPCAANTSDAQEVIEIMNDFAESLATGGYEIDEVDRGTRDYVPGSYVDAIIDY